MGIHKEDSTMEEKYGPLQAVLIREELVTQVAKIAARRLLPLTARWSGLGPRAASVH